MGPRNAWVALAAVLSGSACSVLFEPAARERGTDAGPSLEDGGDARGDADPESDGGGAKKVIFVTSGTYSGALGGLDGADAKCQQHAEAGGLEGTFLAWLSDNSGSPIGRMTRHQGSYVLTNGEEVAAGWDQLTSGILLRPIDRDELGLPPPRAFICLEEGYVWTNTTAGGVARSPDDCDGWLSTDSRSHVGVWEQFDAQWTADDCGEITCTASLPLYCVEQ